MFKQHQLSGRLKNDRTFTCDESETEKSERGAFAVWEPGFPFEVDGERAEHFNIITRGETVYVTGDEETFEIADSLLASLLDLIRKGIEISERDVFMPSRWRKSMKLEFFESMYEEEITKNAKGKPIRVKTIGQREYIAAMKRNDLSLRHRPGRNGENLFGCRKGSP